MRNTAELDLLKLLPKEILFNLCHELLLDDSLNSIEARLPRKYFFRVSRQYIVNLNDIKSIEEAMNDGYEVVMNDGKLLEVSRRNAMELKELLSF